MRLWQDPAGVSDDVAGCDVDYLLVSPYVSFCEQVLRVPADVVGDDEVESSVRPHDAPAGFLPERSHVAAREAWAVVDCAAIDQFVFHHTGGGVGSSLFFLFIFFSVVFLGD